MKRSKGEKVFSVFNLIFMIVLLIITLYPFLNVFVVSFSDNQFVTRGLVTIYPRGFNLIAYKLLLGMKIVWTGYINTFFLVIVGTSINLLLTSMTAYSLSKKDLPGRNKILLFMIFTMMFSGGMIPSFLLIRDLHLMNSLWSMILPGAISAYNMILMKNFFQAIPESLLESARIDGLGEIGILFKIVLPLSTAALATIGLFYAVGHWNAFFNAVMYINDRNKWPLQLVLREILFNSTTVVQSDTDASKIPIEPLKMAVIVATTFPVLLIYPFVQKYFVKGVMIGSVKG